MPIAPRSPASAKRNKKAEHFVRSAPDASRTPTAGVQRGHKQQFSVTLPPHLMQEMDAMAHDMGQSRSALVGMALYQMLQQWRRQKQGV
jgi:hypothetical protein